MGAYDFKTHKGGNSKYLKLGEKGAKVRIRLAGEPYYERQVWKKGEKQPLEPEKMNNLTADQWITILREDTYSVREVFHWPVIDREDSEAKIFSGTATVFDQIAAHAEIKDWGDPTRYDIEVTRTEEPGKNYYKVQAMPDKSDLTEDENEKILKVDMADSLKSAVPITDAVSIEELISDKASTEKKTAKDPVSFESQDQPEVTDMLADGEPMDLNDIPFE